MVACFGRIALPLRACCAAALALAATAEARADGWGGSIGLASDKVYRGISQSAGRPVVLLDVDRHTDTGWAASVGIAGPVYRGDHGGAAELTLAVDKSWQPDPDWTTRIGLSHAAYLGDDWARAYAYTEAAVSAGWQGRVFATLAISPDTSAYGEPGGWRTRGRATRLELSVHQRLLGRLALDAGLGYFDQRVLRDAEYTGYAYGSVGLSWGLGPLQAFFSRIDSQAAERGMAWPSQAGGRWVASLLWSF